MRSNLLEAAIWAFLALLAAGAMLVYKPLPLSNDGIVYLNVGESLRSGKGISTTIVHYDTERSHGRIPAPMTTFPPGYPAAIAFLGGSEFAGRMVSVVSYAATAGLLAWVMIALEVSDLMRILAMVLFLTNVVTLRLATGVLSEAVFTLFGFAALVGVLMAPEVACVAISMAYLVRYAGLFLIPPVVLFTLYARKWLWALLPIAMAGAFFARNAIIVGDWRGGNDMPIVKPLRSLLRSYSYGEVHLMLGLHRSQLGAWEVALTVAVLIVVAWGVTVIPLMMQRTGESWWHPMGIVAFWILFYTAAFLFVARTSVVDLDSRMFVPMVPCYLLLLALALGRWRESPVWKAGLLAIVICVAAINARDLYEPDPPPRAELLRERMAGPVREWVETHIRRDETIFAADGQSTAYLLRRPTVSFVPAIYSPVRWECAEIRKQMDRFGARYLILYKTLAKDAPENEDFLIYESRFIGGSVEDQVACGFSVAVENAGVRVLQIQH